MGWYPFSPPALEKRLNSCKASSRWLTCTGVRYRYVKASDLMRYLFGQCFGSRFAESVSRLFGESGSRSGFLIIKIQKFYSWKKTNFLINQCNGSWVRREVSTLQPPKENIKYGSAFPIQIQIHNWIKIRNNAFPPTLTYFRNNGTPCVTVLSMKINLCEGTRVDPILVPLQFLQEQLNPLLHHLVDGNPSGTNEPLDSTYSRW